jgi:hypothetical protein
MPFKYFNTPPYYDDFAQEKNYTRILFRPGHAVQARELTQMQTALQAQIDRHGRHIFKEGTPVLGGNTTVDNYLDFVKVESSFVTSAGGSTLIADNYYEEFLGTSLTGQTSGVTANVIAVEPSNDDGPITLYLKYTNSGTDKVTKVFAAEEEMLSDALTQRRAKVKPAADTPTGYGMRFNIDESVFFVNGNFVFAASESIIISRYTTTASVRIVYQVTENVVTIAEDSTLGDNALGTSNEAAPGAHRYQILLELSIEPYSFDEARTADIIQLMLIQNGIVKQRARTEYSELAATLAQRTYEESGNYTLRPFMLNNRELYNDGTNNGLYTIPQLRAVYNLTSETDAQVIAYGESRLAVGLEKSVAYVNGYRIELEDIKYISLTKSRETEFFNAASIVADLGNYIYVDVTQSLPDVDTFATLNLKNVGNTIIGTARARSIEFVSGTTYKLYLFDVIMEVNQVFGSVDNIQQTIPTGAQFLADINVTYGAKLQDTATNSLIYQLPFSTIQTLTTGGINDTFYISKRTSSSTDVTGGVSTLSVSDGAIQPYNNGDWIATDASTGAALTISGVSISFNVPTGVSTAVVSFSGFSDGAATIIYPLEKNLTRKTKSLVSNHQISKTAPNVTPGGYDSLGLTDVYRVVSIKDTGVALDAGPLGTPDFLNITDRYEVDNGQRDNFYGIGRIRLKFDATPPVGDLAIVVDYFQHSSGDYFTVDSYSSVDYEYIPAFNSSKGLIQLRDALDFRPTKDNTGNNFTGTGASLVDVIKPGSIIKADLTYYINRLDKVFVDKYGNFGIVEGVSALSPQPPRDPQDSMILYELLVGAFTFGPESINARMIDNRRYTMRDIGKLDRRIKTLEYYTTLSLLEKEAANYELPADHFKNGFLVDNFYGHNVGNPSHPDYSVSMDKSTGIMRPQYVESEVRLHWNDTVSTGLRKTGPLLTLDYTTESYIAQPYSSYAEFVNPYNVFTWNGDMKLSPESDNWKDTETRPTVIIDQEGVYDSFVQLADAAGVTGTVWNEWQTNWSGVVPGATSTSSTSWRDASQRGAGGMGLAVVTGTTTIGTTQTNSVRNGVRTEVVPDTVTTDLGDRVVEVNFVPFIRSRIVSFKADRMKPNTKVYAFFDGKDVTQYATMTSEFFEFSVFSAANPQYTSSHTFNGKTSWPAELSTRIDLTTDASGSIYGFFIVPNNTAMQFRTGQRIFRLTDSLTNTTNSTTTYSEAIYEAAGLIESKENVVLSTRVPRIDRTSVNDNQTTFERGVIASQTQITGWYDPLAQTIMVDEPGGIFATSIDLYFEAFDENVPVSVHLVTTLAGIPSMNIIPFSKVTKTLTSANISADASVATNFTFEAPVHLQQGIEYSLVILSMSDKPKCFVSVMGEYDLTNPTYRISKQPYTGVFFKSQNASTWTPEQEKDLKFNLNRAVFSSYGEAIFNNSELQYTSLGTDPIYTTNGSAIVKVYHKNHGLFVGSEVVLSGIAVTESVNMNGIPIVELNKEQFVTRVERSYYEITVDSTATATGRAGGSSILALGNRLMDVMQLAVQQLVTPNTNIDWFGKVSSGQSLAGTEQPYVVTPYFPIIANENTYYNRPQCVPSTSNQAGGVPGTTFKGVMETNLSNISPVIDLDRVSIFTISNMIDHPTGVNLTDNRNYVENFVEETNATGGSAQSKYITRRVALTEDANQIRIILDVNRPSGTDVEVYYKVQAANDIDFDQDDWQLQAPDTPIGFSENLTSYKEVEYSIDTELGGVEFSSMAIKIVFKSSNSAIIPSCKALRAIAIYG